MKKDEYELNELIEIKRGELIKLKEINHDLLEIVQLFAGTLISRDEGKPDNLVVTCFFRLGDLRQAKQAIAKAEREE